jgi:DNA topoisomerase-1
MKLVIIESPNKIKKLKSILPSDYEIVASVGHLFDLPKKDLGIDLSTFDTNLVLDDSKKDILTNIKKLSNDADVIYLASDMDREGSGISKNIFDALTKKNQAKCKRLLINAITKEAVDAAIKNPTTIDENLCDAQKGRRVTDRLVGYQISPIMWSKGLRGTSAGRVQSVALKYISDLEKEIKAFKPEEYWKAFLKNKDFSAELFSIDGDSYHLKNKEEADSLMKDALSGKSTAKVVEYNKKTRTRSPEAPFITSTIQQAASNLFGWNAQKTMQVAQSLFASGLITYLRTDSTRIEPDKIKSVREKIDATYGVKYLPATPREFANKDASQDAHEAIRPTYEPPLNPLSAEEKKLLDLVDRRFKASQMADATFDQAVVKIEVNSSNHSYIFKVNGSVMTFDGFLKVYGENKEDLVLPSLTVGQAVGVEDILTSQHFTQPPGRYSDASLIKKLEKEGVGRPSTYASIIETVINRGYVERDKKSLHSTELGIMVSDFLSAAFPNLVSPEMTSKMEEDLDLIASGKGDYKKIMSEFYTQLSDSISSAKKITSLSVFKVDRKCPECSSELLKKKGEYGIILGCSSYPKCGYVIKFGENGEETSDQEQTGVACPDCGGKLANKKSKFGDFLGCTSYPSCKWTGKLDQDGNPVKNIKSSVDLTDIDCNVCKKAKMAKRKGKFGEFLGCSDYPNCKNIINLDKDGNALPPKTEKKKASVVSTGKKCPKCKQNDLVEREGKYGKFISCSGYPDCKHIEKKGK